MLKNIFKKITQKIDYYSGHKKAPIFLYADSFLESIVFPIPPDVFLVPLVMAQPKRWLEFSIGTTIFSVFGALVGYTIGLFFFDVLGEKIVETYHLSAEVAKLGDMFQKNTFLALFIAAFTPIPFKVFTLSAGLFAVPVVPFVVASFAGRFFRFGLIAYLLKRFGKPMRILVKKYFNILSLLFMILVVLAVFIL